MIQSITLRNFKSFREATFPLGPFSLVLGPNAAGKSNFFDALRFLRFLGMGSSIRDAIEGHMSSLPLDLALPGIRGGASALTHFGSESSVFEISAEFKAEARSLKYRIGVDAASYRVVSEELNSTNHPGDYVFSTFPTVGPLTQDHDSPVITARFYKGTRGMNPRREFSPHESILSQFSQRRAESRVNEEAADLARRELQSIRPLELRPEVLRQYSPVGRFELGEHGENLGAVAWLLQQLKEADADGSAKQPSDAGDRLEAIEAWLSELTPHAVTSIAPEVAPTGEVIFGLREEGFARPLSARSLSDGTLRFAALTFAVLGSANRQTLVVEELENGINPARLALLVQMLVQAVETNIAVQIIASTHAPGIIGYAPETVLANSCVIGWNSEHQCSMVVPLMGLPDFARLRDEVGLDRLQEEGWFQAAALG